MLIITFIYTTQIQLYSFLKDLKIYLTIKNLKIYRKKQKKKELGPPGGSTCGCPDKIPIEIPS